MREELRCTTTTDGVPYVMTPGVTTRHWWCVRCWGTKVLYKLTASECGCYCNVFNLFLFVVLILVGPMTVFQYGWMMWNVLVLRGLL